MFGGETIIDRNRDKACRLGKTPEAPIVFNRRTEHPAAAMDMEKGAARFTGFGPDDPQNERRPVRPVDRDRLGLLVRPGWRKDALALGPRLPDLGDGLRPCVGPARMLGPNMRVQSPKIGGNMGIVELIGGEREKRGHGVFSDRRG